MESSKTSIFLRVFGEQEFAKVFGSVACIMFPEDACDCQIDQHKIFIPEVGGGNTTSTSKNLSDQFAFKTLAVDTFGSA